MNIQLQNDIKKSLNKVTLVKDMLTPARRPKNFSYVLCWAQQSRIMLHSSFCREKQMHMKKNKKSQTQTEHQGTAL